MSKINEIKAFEVTTYEAGFKPTAKRFTSKFEAYRYALEAVNYRPLSLEREGVITAFKGLEVEVEVEPIYA